MKVKKLQAFPNIAYSEFMVATFEVTQTSGNKTYWAGLFQTGSQQTALEIGETNIVKAEKPIAGWGKKRNWFIYSSIAEIIPLTIYQAKKIVIV